VRLERKNKYKEGPFNFANCGWSALPLEGWDIPSAYARSAAFAVRWCFGPKEMAARAADIASLCRIAWAG